MGIRVKGGSLGEHPPQPQRRTLNCLMDWSLIGHGVAEGIHTTLTVKERIATAEELAANPEVFVAKYKADYEKVMHRPFDGVVEQVWLFVKDLVQKEQEARHLADWSKAHMGPRDPEVYELYHPKEEKRK
jgi:hypothetical protein